MKRGDKLNSTSRNSRTNSFSKSIVPSSPRSQTTIFIIIAIVIVVVAALIIFLGGFSGGEKPPIFKSQIDQIKDNVVKCSRDNARDGIKRIGLQGGYYNKPEYAEDLGWAFIPYYYFQGNIFLPNKTVIEQQVSSYVDDQMVYCLQNIPMVDYTMTYDKPKTRATISPGKIRLVVDLPIVIAKGEQVTNFQLRDSEIVYNSSLYEIYEVADFITKTHKENDTLFCASCVVDMAKDRNLYVDLIDYKDSSTMVMLSENWSYKEPYLFEFLNKY